MNGNCYATTMCTGNLRSATENLYRYLETKNKHCLKNSLQYLQCDCILYCRRGSGKLPDAAHGRPCRMGKLHRASGCFSCHVSQPTGERSMRKDTSDLKEQKDHGTAIFPCGLYEVKESCRWRGVRHHWHDENRNSLFCKRGVSASCEYGNLFAVAGGMFLLYQSRKLQSIEPRTRGKEFAVLFHPCISGFESCDRAQTGLMQLLLQGSMGFPRCLDSHSPVFSGCVGMSGNSSRFAKWIFSAGR